MHYVNFEKNAKLSKLFEPDLNPKRIISELCFILDDSIDLEKDLIIFDEIQACPKALTSLKYFQEDIPNLYLCAAGSLLGIYLNSESFPVGKVDMLYMHPLSFLEFLQAIEDTQSFNFINNITKTSKLSSIIHSHLWEKLKWYLIVGGLPEVVKLFKENRDNLYNAFMIARKKQNDLILAYGADIAKHSGKVNAMHIDRIWNAVPAQLAAVNNDSSNRFKFKGIIPGINRYSQLVGAIDWLVSTGLVIKLHVVNKGNLPFLAHTKENIFKLAMFDVGILSAMCELSPKNILDYNYGSYKGYIAENFVAQEFLCKNNLLNRLYSWKEKGSEVEFLMEVDGNAIPIEVKSGKVTQSKSSKVFYDKYQPPYRVVFSAKDILDVNYKKSMHYYPLYLAGLFPLK